MRIFFVLKLLVFLLVIGISFVNVEGNPELEKVDYKVIVKIYFIPFKDETYGPITIDDIEDASIYSIWFTEKNAFIEKLKKLLESKEKSKGVDNDVIRLKVEFVEERSIYFVDQEGNVMKNHKSNFRIPKKELENLEKEILYFSGVVDLKAGKDLKKQGLF